MLTRREAFLGLTVIAAPFVIRTPGLVMPVRARLSRAEEITEWLQQDSKRKLEAAVREIERLRAKYDSKDGTRNKA
jgi:hypothetical protein